MLKRIYHVIATVGYIGHIPLAPGTFGTAAAFILAILFKPGDLYVAWALIPLFIIGVLASQSVEEELGKDSGSIVIDEFCGYWVSTLFIPRSTGFLIAAFILFRFFDIFKPPPVGAVERALSGGKGIMLDDVVAGVYANVCIQVWIIFMGY